MCRFKVNGYTSKEFSFISLGNRGKLLKEKNCTRSLRRSSLCREASQKSQKLFPLGEKTWKYAHTPEAGLPRSGKNTCIWKMKFFPSHREKFGNFMDGQGNLERTWKVRGSENLKIIGYGRQSSENLFILFKRRKDVHSHEIV